MLCAGSVTCDSRFRILLFFFSSSSSFLFQRHNIYWSTATNQNSCCVCVGFISDLFKTMVAKKFETKDDGVKLHPHRSVGPI